MIVCEMQERDKQRWDDYVRHAKGGLPQHLSGWREVMSRTYGYKSHYLMAFEQGQVKGVLPLFQIKSWLLGKSLTTLPGGFCADTQEAAHMLLQKAQELAHAANVSRLTLHDSRRHWESDLVSVNHHASCLLLLPDTVDAAWKGLKKKLRREVSLALKEEVTTKITRDPEQLEDFYQAFSSFTQQMGTPAFGRTFLRHVVETFADQFHICCLYHKGEVIGAFFNLELEDRIYGVWGASFPQYYHLRPNYQAYWKMIEYGIEHGFRRYDLGRSQLDSGPYKFKKKWRGEEQPIYQQHYFVKEQATTLDNPREQLQHDGKFRLFTNLWRQLPLPVTQVIGPQLRRHIPFG